MNEAHRNVGTPASLSSFINTNRIGERNSNFKIEIMSTYCNVIDVFLSETERKFEDNSEILEAISNMDKFDTKSLKVLTTLGKRIPSDEEMSVANNYIALRRKKHDEELCEKAKMRKANLKIDFGFWKSY